MRIAAVPPVSRTQAGVFTARQALDAGWSHQQIRRRVTTGAWERPTRATLCLPGGLATPVAAAHAVHLTVPGAVVSHLTAAALHGFPVAHGAELHASMPGRAKRLKGLTVWSWDVPAAERGLWSGVVPVTSPARTAIDCLATLSRTEALALLAWVWTRQVVGADQLAAGLHRYRWRTGADQLREIAFLTRTGALSAAESLCHGLLEAACITGWTANARVCDDRGVICVADVLFERERVVVEVDGWATHGSREAFEKDRRVQSRLAAAGYLVIRVTWAELSAGGRDFLRQLPAALARRRHLVDGPAQSP